MLGLVSCEGPGFELIAVVRLLEVDGPLFSCIGVMTEICSEAVLITGWSSACLLCAISVTY